MDFEDVVRLKRLPPLAWSLDVGSGRLTAGAWVEVDGGTCFEGARTAPDLLDERGCVFGSGVVRRPGGYTCVPPTHTLDGLYVVIRHEGGATVTNSLVWALSDAGLTAEDSARLAALPPGLRTATLGIAGYRNRLIALRGVSVLQMLHAPFELSADRLVERPVAFPRPSELDFATYKAALLDAVGRTLGHSPRFSRLVSTCSSGYAAAACTAIGKEAGLEAALTVASAGEDGDDSGERPAREMGVGVHTFDDLVEVPGGDLSEEFVAAYATRGDVRFKAFEAHLAGAVLLTGFHGAIWDGATAAGPWLRRADPGGAGLNEFRLRVGFVHLPLPFVLARQAPAIERLSQSPEMRRWRTQPGYDRPIARRLAEEAGASRESFGLRRRAADRRLEVDPTRLGDAFHQVAGRYAARGPLGRLIAAVAR